MLENSHNTQLIITGMTIFSSKWLVVGLFVDRGIAGMAVLRVDTSRASHIMPRQQFFSALRREVSQDENAPPLVVYWLCCVQNDVRERT